jgi:RNA polymerase sigma-54 factor
MEMKQTISTQMRQQQRLVMTPKLQQALKLLQVPTLELEQILKEEVLQNPLLEEIDPSEEDEPDQDQEREREAEPSENGAGAEEEQTPEAAAEAPEPQEPEDPVDWDDYFNDGFSGQAYEQEHEELDERFERVAVAQESGYQQLLKQLRLTLDDELDLQIGEYVIGSLNTDGFLTCDVEEVARTFEVDVARVEAVLKVIQSFDPPGIAARNLQEALLLQLDARGETDSLAAEVVRDHFDSLKSRKFNEIAKELKISTQEVQEIAQQIGHLDPRPGLATFSENAKYVVPDLVVEKVDGEYIVYLNDSNIPRLRVSRAYRDELNRSRVEGDKATAEFIMGRLNSAKWLIQTIEQRRRTIVKVMQCIVDEQREFFDKGPVALKPLTLQQVANRIGMHESTVSRVTTNKYVQTPRGVFELKYFFSSSLDTDDGENMSSKAAKTRIREIIDGEEKRRPLSDQKIVDLLKLEGLNIARRTVAKYREQLSILPARMRKTY